MVLVESEWKVLTRKSAPYQARKDNPVAVALDPIVLSGDVCLRFLHRGETLSGSVSEVDMFRCQFHTSFLDQDVMYTAAIPGQMIMFNLAQLDEASGKLLCFVIIIVIIIIHDISFNRETNSIFCWFHL